MSITSIESAQRQESGTPVFIPGRIIAQFECAKDAQVCQKALTAHHGTSFTITPGIDMMYAVRPLIREAQPLPSRRYPHDCNHCTYLGEFQQYDLYHCLQNGYPTVVVRYGSDGPEYTSGKEFAAHNPGIAEAVRICAERGLAL